MNGLAINAIHAAGGLAGLAAILHSARPGASLRRLWIVTIAASVPMAAFLLAVSQTLGFFGDYRKAYWPAGRAALEGADALRPLLEDGVYGFVNLPVVALLFAPVAAFPERISASLFSAAGLIALAAAFLIAARLYGFDARRSAIAVFACAAYGPLVYSIKEGNTSHVLLVCLVAGMALLRSRRDLWAGALFGLAAVIKPSLVLVGIYFALRGRFRAFLGGFLVCAGLGALSVAVYGWDLNVLWFEEFRAYGSAPIPAFNNQSIAAAASRLISGTPGLLDWDPHALPPTLGVAVTAVSVLLAALGIAAAILHGRKAARPASPAEIELELLMTVTLLCIVGTVSWSHYHCWLLAAFAFAWTDLGLRAGAEGRGARVALAVAFVLTAPAEFLSDQMATGAYGPLTGLLTAHLLIGTLILYAVLAWLRLRGPILAAEPISCSGVVAEAGRLRAAFAGGGRV